MNGVVELKAAQERLLQRLGLRADSHFLSVSVVSGRVHVLTTGEGPPVVMLAGFGHPAAIWAPLMAELDGFGLCAVDRPNVGLTGHAFLRTASIRRLAVEFLEEVLDELGLLHPIFVANAIGSLWTLWFALDRPHRVGAMVHLGCPAFILGTSAPLSLRLFAMPGIGNLLTRLNPPSSRQVDQFASTVGENLSHLPELRELLVAVQKLPNTRQAVRELLRAYLRLGGPRPDIVLKEKDLAQVNQPVQLIWGGRDPFGGVDVGKRVAAALPNAELHVIPEGSHVPWVGNPGTAAEFIRPFLEEQAARIKEESTAFRASRSSSPRSAPPFWRSDARS